MRRREFITLLSGGAAWLLRAHSKVNPYVVLLSWTQQQKDTPGAQERYMAHFTGTIDSIILSVSIIPSADTLR